MSYLMSTDSFPAKYVTSGHLVSRDNFVHEKRAIDENVLIMVVEGRLHISINSREYSLGPNQFIVLKQGELHQGYKPSTGRLAYNWVHFKLSEEFIRLSEKQANGLYIDHISNQGYNSMVLVPEKGDINIQSKVKVLFNQLLDVSRHDNPFTLDIANYALSVLLMELTQEFFDNYNHHIQNIHPNIVRIIAWIKANYYKPLTVKSIADEFGYNSDYLSSLFKQSAHMTLIHYLNKVRVDISKTLLINYDLAIKEIAYSCGFSDPKYYMKVFKNYELMTPTQYRHTFSKRHINSGERDVKDLV